MDPIPIIDIADGSRKRSSKDLLPPSYSQDTGARQTLVQVTEVPGATIEVVKEAEATNATGGCGCAATDTGCSCAKQRLKMAAMAVATIGVFILLAYGASKFFND